MMKADKKFILILFTVLTCGISAGWFYGTFIANRLMRGDITFSVFIFTPSKNMIDTYTMLNSRNDLKRLEGYYAYRETGLRDLDFLYERYRAEDSEIIRKTIIWIAEKVDPDEKLKFYKKLHEVSQGTLKRYLQTKIESFKLMENNKHITGEQ